MPRPRKFAVTISEHEAARLRAFEKKPLGRHWPGGPSGTFLRRNETTFVVKERAITVEALVTTLGTATLRQDDRVDVAIVTKAQWLGYLIIAGGLVCLAVTPREGFWAVALGVGMLLAGWFLYVNPPWGEEDFDKVETVLRNEITGDWRPAVEGQRQAQE